MREVFDSFYNFFANALWVYIDRRNVFAQSISIPWLERRQERLLVCRSRVE
jgi:hypothetical protein